MAARFFLLIGIFGWLAPAAAPAASIDKVLVVVNEEAVTLSEYQARHQREALEQTELSARIAPFDGDIDARILNRMIDDRIQAQIAARRGLSVAADEVERALATIAERNNLTAARLLERLDEVGITAAQFRASVREQRLIRRLIDLVVNSRVAVSEREVENFLASHAEMTASDDQFEVSHLFVSVGGKTDAEIASERENLEHLRQGLLDGRSFAKFVADYSDNADKDAGGYLGWRKVGQFPDSFVAALRATEVGGISEIVRSDNGLHLLKLHDRRQAGTIVQQQRIRHILIRPGPGQSMRDAGQLAAELRAQIAAGEAFEKIARVHSADQASGAEGGELGWVNPGDFPPDFERAAGELAVGELSEPVRTSAGYHLIEVLARRDSDISLALAARRARQMIFQRKAAEFYDNWYGALRDSAYIEYIAVNPG